jgi:hypothetical protein
MAKDLFSAQAKSYARYRPGYPTELFEFIASLNPHHQLAWDCATGNGQAAVGLSPFYQKIIATDISESQLSFATQKENIEYRIASAENSGLENNSVDLITTAQAYHWLNWDQFHKEANRVARKNAVVAIWMYNRMIIGDPLLEEIYNRFYFEITGPYWDPERKYVDDNYETVKFDFADCGKKEFTGYLSSWSASLKYQKQNKHSALDLIKDELIANWKNAGTRPFIFPIWLRYGRIA